MQGCRQLAFEALGDFDHFFCAFDRDDQAERSEDFFCECMVGNPVLLLQHGRDKVLHCAGCRRWSARRARRCLSSDAVAAITIGRSDAIGQHDLRADFGKSSTRGFRDRVCLRGKNDGNARIGARTGKHPW